MKIKHNRHTAVMHVSATKLSQNYSFQDCKSGHLAKGWSDIGYHYYITQDGEIHKGRSIDKNGAHVRGYNNGTIGICTEGGIGENGVPVDTMNAMQMLSVEGLLLALKKGNSKMKVKGHRDYSPDLNKNGKIESNEFIKMCPCYDAQVKFKVFNGDISSFK
jgi:N-acetyl-anhydromuramyl-L-alanine amidase AmpD